MSLGLYHPSSRESVVSTRVEGISLAVLWYQVTPKYARLMPTLIPVALVDKPTALP
jgi:hypothetical protein